MFLRYFHVRYSARWFAFLIFLGYGIVSLLAYYNTSNPTYLHVSLLAFISTVTVIAFSEISLSATRVRFPKVVVGVRILFFGVFGLFGAFALLVTLTAEGIPLKEWFAGADATTLVVLREKFLKAREGWQAVFPYINALFTGALIPYCLACFLSKKIDGAGLHLVSFYFIA